MKYVITYCNLIIVSYNKLSMVNNILHQINLSNIIFTVFICSNFKCIHSFN